MTPTSTTLPSAESALTYSDGIAAARTLIALEGSAAALQRRLPSGWELAPYAGDDLRGTSLRGANLLVPFHEVYAVRTPEGKPTGLPQVSYIAFISQASSPISGGRKPSPKRDAARPKFGRLSPPWPTAVRSICRSPIGKVAW
jgi:hypothetical protein